MKALMSRQGISILHWDFFLSLAEKLSQPHETPKKPDNDKVDQTHEIKAQEYNMDIIQKY